MLTTHLYRHRPLTVWRCREPKLVSAVGEEHGVFVGRLREALREQRDLAVEKLRRRYASKLARIQDQIARAEQRVEVEEAQYRQKRMQTVISVGATVVGALFGRKMRSVGTVGRAATAMRGAGSAAKEKGDIARAGERVEALQQRLVSLEADLQDDLALLVPLVAVLFDPAALRGPVDTEALAVTEVRVAPRKSDLAVEELAIMWVPWRVTASGGREPA